MCTEWLNMNNSLPSEGRAIEVKINGTFTIDGIVRYDDNGGVHLLPLPVDLLRSPISLSPYGNKAWRYV